jgi:hypothetical protein
LLDEAKLYFHTRGLGQKQWFVEGSSLPVLTWRRDYTNDALALLLTAKGLATSNERVALRVSSVNHLKLKSVLEEIAALSQISMADLRLKPDHIIREKWDWVLPDSLRTCFVCVFRLGYQRRSYNGTRIAVDCSTRPQVGEGSIPASLREVVVRAGGLEPPRPVRVCGFSYHFGFRRTANGGFVVWTIPSPFSLGG